jgi:hypothetical protein
MQSFHGGILNPPSFYDIENVNKYQSLTRELSGALPHRGFRLAGWVFTHCHERAVTGGRLDRCLATTGLPATKMISSASIVPLKP